MYKSIITNISLLLLILFGSTTWAQSSTTVGQYQINHIAYNSTFLERDIARLYQITRSKNRAVINISVQDTENEGKGVEAKVSGTATNIINQIKKVNFRKIEDGDAIYYISDYRFDEGDVLTFKIDVTLPGQSRTKRVEWQQKFWKQ